MMNVYEIGDFCHPLENVSAEKLMYEREETCVDDDITRKLQSSLLPLEIQLLLVPMWTVRSDYQDCMHPLDKAMENYMQFRIRLLEIDEHIEFGTASGSDVVTAFDQVLSLYHVYERNQVELNRLLKQVHHQILFFSHATKDDLMWNEMVQLKDIDYRSFTTKTCCFEHAVVSLFKLDESIKDSLQTSQEISRCCANYLIRIAQHFSDAKRPCSEEEEEKGKEEIVGIEEGGRIYTEKNEEMIGG